MPAAVWSDKRQRQHEHVEKSLESRGKSEAVAEEIAARTVDEDRARHAEAKTASRAPTTTNPPALRRGGLRSHQGEGGRTLKQLRRGRQGRSDGPLDDERGRARARLEARRTAASRPSYSAAERSGASGNA